MSHLFHRRALLRTAGLLPLAGALPSRARAAAADGLAALEAASGGRLGVAALNTANGERLGHRDGERFAFCSTFKILAASALLKRSEAEPGLLERRIPIAPADVVAYSPVTKPHAGDGMRLADLCAAGLQYSDNTAANLMIGLLGGPAGVTAFARSIGDHQFRLDRLETVLNTAVPGDVQDTSTPAAMASALHRLALGDLLGQAQREQLVAWMRGNTTGAKRIRAGVPGTWAVADKTGTGDYGTTNDVGLVWPPNKPPVVLAIYYTQADPKAAPRDDVVAEAARSAVAALVVT